jgi:hypothetical protein
MFEILLIAQLACVETYPGAKRPLDWSYRTVEGRKCWYQGPRMMPKDKLMWERPDEMPTITAPDIIAPEPPDDDGTFLSRWPRY